MDGGSGGADRRGPDKRGSFTHRSELSDSLRRANNQETNRLQIRVQSYDRARELAVNEISQQERFLLSSTRGRRSSSPGPAIRALIQEQLSAEKQKWKEKFTSFMTSDIKGRSTEDINITGRRLFGSTEHLGNVRYYDDDAPKKTPDSSEELQEDDQSKILENKSQNNNKDRKLAREQIWRNLSQPKHPKTSLKQLREKIESDVKRESWSKSNSVPKVQTLPIIAPESKSLIASVDKGDKNSRSNKSMFLTVPNVIHTSRSDENLAAMDPNAMTFETQEVIKFDPQGRTSPVFPGNGLGSLPLRRRTKSLVISSERLHDDTGNQIDLRLLPPKKVANERPRSVSDSYKERNIIVPELRVDLSD